MVVGLQRRRFHPPTSQAGPGYHHHPTFPSFTLPRWILLHWFRCRPRLCDWSQNLLFSGHLGSGMSPAKASTTSRLVRNSSVTDRSTPDGSGECLPYSLLPLRRAFGTHPLQIILPTYLLVCQSLGKWLSDILLLYCAIFEADFTSPLDEPCSLCYMAKVFPSSVMCATVSEMGQMSGPCGRQNSRPVGLSGCPFSIGPRLHTGTSRRFLSNQSNYSVTFRSHSPTCLSAFSHRILPAIPSTM